MKRFYFVFVLFFFFIQVLSLSAQPEITSSLNTILSEKAPWDFLSINIRLSVQYDEALLLEQSRLIRSPAKRREYVVHTLKEFSRTEQSELMALLSDFEVEGKVRRIKPLWIGNLVNCEVLPEVVDILSTRKDLARLDYNKMQQVLDHFIPDESFIPASPDQLKNGNSIIWSLNLINAPEVWGEGYTGEGAIVAVIDSGVNYNHQDLSGNMWSSFAYPYHGYNFLNDSNNPMDDNGHGTHCAGTIAGNGTAGTQTGVAPDATIMALKVLDWQGNGTEASVWSAIEFSIEHGAHIMSLSLGWQQSWNPDRSMWRTTMNNALAAGLIASVAAGNEGDSFFINPPDQVRTPGDVPPPWTHPGQTAPGGNSAVVSVGSTTSTDAISSFSSRGPVTWQNVTPFNDYPYNPNIGLIRPDIVAPGSNITSLTYDNNTGYTDKSGTSMATPAVAGVMALMISKNPGITPEMMSEIMETTATPLSFGKSNTFGSGRINAMAAVEEIPFMGLRYVSHQIVEIEGNQDSMINPGEHISLTLVMENPTDEDINVDATGRLLLASEYSELIDSVAIFGEFEAGEVKILENIFSFWVAEDMPGNHELLFTIEAFTDEEETVWKSRFSETGYAPELIITQMKIIDDEGGNGNGRLDPGETAIIQFMVKNNGQITSESLVASLTSSDSLLLVTTPEINGSPIIQDDFFLANFEVKAYGSIIPGSIYTISLELNSGPYLITNDYLLKVGQIVEDWESGDFEQYEWELTGNAGWQIVSDEVFEGGYAVRSGSINHNASSGLLLTLDVIANDTISFYRKVSSENNFDWLEFHIDGVRVDRWSGAKNWEKYSYPVSQGIRTFSWIYKKDFSVSSGADAGWIDYIELPAIIRTVAFAGFDNEHCGDGPFELHGFASQYDEVLWSSSGDGFFAELGDLETSYTPGSQDIIIGNVKLTLKAFRDNLVKAEHSMQLIFLPTPELDLGGDITLCTDHITLLNAGSGHSSYLWSNGNEQPHLWVSNEEFGPESTIWAEVSNEYGCFSRDSVVVTFDPCLDVTSPDQTEEFLALYPNPASNKVHIVSYNPGPGPAIIRIIDIRGQVVHHEILQNFGNFNHELDISGLLQGLYYVMLESQSGKHVKPLSIY